MQIAQKLVKVEETAAAHRATSPILQVNLLWQPNLQPPAHQNPKISGFWILYNRINKERYSRKKFRKNQQEQAPSDSTTSSVNRLSQDSCKN